MSKKLTPEEREARRIRLREKARKWREEHPGYDAQHKSKGRREGHAAYMRKWYERHPGFNYENVKQWRKENKEKWLAYSRAYSTQWRKRSPQKASARDRRVDLKRKYGVTVEWYEAKLLEQNGGCAICGCVEKIAGRNHPVDHNHSTGKTRGILCQHCNVSLHRLEGHANWIEKAADYLKLYG